MPNVEALKANNAIRWANARLTRGPQFDRVADQLVGARARYKAVEARTGVPWFIVAVIHQRESSGSFAGVLHNGEKIIGTGKLTKLVPKGRGPFTSWEEAAVDALINCHPYAARNMDWSPGGALALLEQYNGLGYFNKGIPSPYIWAGTNQYTKGKYVADGKFDPEHVDQQLGCAGIIKAMNTIDPSVKLTGFTPPPLPDIPVPEPAPPAQSGGFFHLIAALFAALFKRKP